MRRLIHAGVHMRIHLLGLVLLAGLAIPASAQRGPTLDQRVTRVEQELRAVQRRVFPGGNAQFVEPEINPQAGPPPGGNATGDALRDLSARVDAIEAQLRSLTGQVEEATHRGNALEEQLSRLRADLGGRIERLEAAPRPAVEPPPVAPSRARPEEAAPPPAATPVRPAPSSPDDAEGAYNAGFRLWDQHHYAEAQAALEAAATRFPNSRWIKATTLIPGKMRVCYCSMLTETANRICMSPVGGTNQTPTAPITRTGFISMMAKASLRWRKMRCRKTIRANYVYGPRTLTKMGSLIYLYRVGCCQANIQNLSAVLFSGMIRKMER